MLPMINAEPSASRVLLALLPQSEPFRFVDEIREVDDNRLVATNTFDGHECFYSSHFPGDPITPGVILLETMAQTASLQAYFLLAKELGSADAALFRLLLTDCELEIYQPVIPPATILIESTLIFWRSQKLRTLVQMFNCHKQLVAKVTLGVLGLRRI